MTHTNISENGQSVLNVNVTGPYSGSIRTDCVEKIKHTTNQNDLTSQMTHGDWFDQTTRPVSDYPVVKTVHFFLTTLDRSRREETLGPCSGRIWFTYMILMCSNPACKCLRRISSKHNTVKHDWCASKFVCIAHGFGTMLQTTSHDGLQNMACRTNW